MSSSPSGVYHIYLMRHAHAGPPKPSQKDFDRELDARGREEVAIVARQAEAFGLHPAMILTSAASRCRQTAAEFEALFPDIPAETSDALYSGSADTYLELIMRHQNLPSLMIVGHNPVMEELTELLMGHDAAGTVIPYGFPTAGLIGLDLERPANATSKLTAKASFLITPSFSEAY